MRRPPLDSGLETGQRDLLAAIEQLAAQHAGFLHALSPCLKALLEERVLTEAAVLAWGTQRDSRPEAQRARAYLRGAAARVAPRRQGRRPRGTRDPVSRERRADGDGDRARWRRRPRQRLASGESRPRMGRAATGPQGRRRTGPGCRCRRRLTRRATVGSGDGCVAMMCSTPIEGRGRDSFPRVDCRCGRICWCVPFSAVQ